MGLLAWIKTLFGPRKGSGDDVPPVDPVGPLDVSRQAVALFNARRKGLPPLAVSAALQGAADAHAARQASLGVMSHQEIGEPGLGERLNEAGYRWSGCAENVAEGQLDAASVVGAWMASPGHRANIMGPYRDAAVSVAVSSTGVTYWTAVFASPA